MVVAPAAGEGWTPVCVLENIPVHVGVAALVRGRPVAVFRDTDDRVYALSNHDPFDPTGGLARGIVGARAGVPFVAPASHRCAFDLRTGACLDDPDVNVTTYDVRIVDGLVHVGPRRDPALREAR